MAFDEPIDAEVVDTTIVDADEPAPNVAALAPIQRTDSQLVRPAADLESVEQAFRDYQHLYRSLLDDTDFQDIQGKRFPKKSAWRKLSVAFGVTFELIDRVIDREGRDVQYAEFVVRAIAPNGRSADGWGACDLFEKCCPPDCPRRSYDDHLRRGCCNDGCAGAKHFSHPNHDIPATAETRAKNRAASDLFGMGEVSAEEVSGISRSQPEQRQAPAKTLMTDKQRRAMFAACRTHHIDDPVRKLILRHAYNVDSSKHLSEAQARHLLDALSDDGKRAKLVAVPGVVKALADSGYQCDICGRTDGLHDPAPHEAAEAAQEQTA